MGGQPAGPVNMAEHVYDPWEKRVDAMFSLLVQKKKLMRVDELRRGIESLEPNAYDNLTYYERWIASIAKILVEKGVLNQAELDARVAEIEQRPPEELDA
jgi:hypothetical protein